MTALILIVLIFLCMPLPARADITTGLVGYWKFDEGGGTTAADASGNNNTATLVNGPTVVPGKSALGLSFNGGPYVGLTSNPISDLSSASTVCGWVKINDINAVSNAYSQTVINLTINGNNFLRIANDEASTPKGRLAMTYKVNGSYLGDARGMESGSPVLVNNNWVHLCVVSTGVTLTLYVNGSSVAIGASPTGPYSDGNINAIGSRAAANGGWAGAIDDVRIYNRALTASDVAELYQQNAVPQDGLVSWWTFDEGAGTTVKDPVGYNNGDLTGHAPTFITGKNGQALSFTAGGQYVQFSFAAANITATGALTFSAWVKTSASTAVETNILQIGGDFNKWALYIDSVDAGKPSFSITGAYAARLKATTNIKDGLWHLVVGSFDGITAYIYVDGSLQNSAAKTLLSQAGTLTSRIGVNNNGTDQWSGMIDDVRIYNRALSAAEVLALYRDGSGPAMSGVSSVKGVASVRF